MKFSLLIVFLLMLSACEKSQETPQPMTRGAVLAEVNGKKIYQQDLDMTLVDMFGEYQASMLDQEGRKKALESLVASKALMDMAARDIDADVMQAIDNKTERYRENLVINAYVKDQIVAEPVSNKMVEDYYNSHLEKFGQKTLRQYELLSSEQGMTPEQRDRFLQAFEKLRERDPQEIQTRLAKQGYPVSYHQGVTGDANMPARLRDFIAAQPLNQLSAIAFIDGRPYAVRVNKDVVKPAKPLTEVSQDIRKSLAMVQLKKEIKKLSSLALEQATVVYR